MASDVGIANRALQRLGAGSIVALTDANVNARAVNVAFATIREAELRAHPWSFAIKRAQLAAGTAPAFGPTNSYPLPSDFLRLLPPDPEGNFNTLDWRIEGRNILTDDAAPLEVRYIYTVTDPNTMDALFREAFALRLARELCETLTKSNTKVQIIDQEYKEVIAQARNTNAIEQVAVDLPEDTWVTVRL